jgi:membrane-bound serine protease (ClpP class)
MTALIVVLLVIGASLLVAEAHLTSHGVLGVAGLASIAGGIVLWAGESGSGAAVALVVPIMLVLAALGAVAGRKTRQVRGRRALGGGDGLVGRVGVVRHDLAPLGDVFVAGELWQARPSPLHEGDDPPLVEGEHVVVERVRGLTVSVRRAEEWELLP